MASRPQTIPSTAARGPTPLTSTALAEFTKVNPASARATVQTYLAAQAALSSPLASPNKGEVDVYSEEPGEGTGSAGAIQDVPSSARRTSLVARMKGRSTITDEPGSPSKGTPRNAVTKIRGAPQTVGRATRTQQDDKENRRPDKDPSSIVRSSRQRKTPVRVSDAISQRSSHSSGDERGAATEQQKGPKRGTNSNAEQKSRPRKKARAKEPDDDEERDERALSSFMNLHRR